MEVGKIELGPRGAASPFVGRTYEQCFMILAAEILELKERLKALEDAASKR